MASAALPSPELSPPALPNGDSLYEILDGQIVENPSIGARANRLAGKLYARLEEYAEQSKVGQPFIETLFRLPLRNRDQQRRPDVSFVSYERWPAAKPLPDPDPWDVVPDLAVESVSQSNAGELLLERLRNTSKLAYGWFGSFIPIALPCTSTKVVPRFGG
jgi:Uma2 family endonuclease